MVRFAVRNICGCSVRNGMTYRSYDISIATITSERQSIRKDRWAGDGSVLRKKPYVFSHDSHRI